MAKIVRVAGAASAEPQEVPGYWQTFPVSLADSGWTEAEWRADPGFKNGRFEIVDSSTRKGKAASDAADKAGVADVAANSDDINAGAAGDEGGAS